MKSRDLSPEDVEGVQSVIANSYLASVDFYEVSARRTEISPEADEGKLEVQVQHRSAEGAFGVRLNAVATIPGGEATAMVVGEYNLLNDTVPAKRHLQHFTNEVAVMMLYPYLREAIATITAKVFGSPVHLPIVQRGEISIDVDGAAQSPEETD